MLKIFGEILSFSTISIEAYERSCKTYKKSIIAGLIRYYFQALADVLLGEINGVIVTLMAILRHIFMYKKKFAGKIFWLWITISVIINIYFANTIVDLFPLIATLQFTFMVRHQNTKWLKYAQIINSLIWSVYHIGHHAYVYLIANVILVIITLIRVKAGVED